MSQEQEFFFRPKTVVFWLKKKKTGYQAMKRLPKIVFCFWRSGQKV